MSGCSGRSTLADLFGSKLPRIYTPELRDLSVPDATLGHDFIAFADAIGVGLFPWQKWLALHMLELNRDGSLRYRTVILLIARQNGKTTILKLLALFWMYVLGRPLVVGTAQNLDTAEETWQDAVNLAEAVDALAEDIANVVRQSGKKALELVGKERYKVVPSTRGGGRGLSGDLIEMDELREHRNWESWAAVSNTTMAIDSALVIAASNAGDLMSVVLRSLRFMALSESDTVGVTVDELASFGQLPPSGDEPDEIESDAVGIFEWSAHPKCGIWDRDGWAAANPSLGYTITEAAMAANAKIARAGGEAEWVYRTENLCQWRPTAAGGPFPDGAWEAGVDPLSSIGVESPIGVCVDVSADRGMSYVAVAGARVDGDLHVEVVAARAGTEWLVPWLTSPDRRSADRWVAVCWQLNGAPVSSLTDELRATDLPLQEWGGADLARAHGQTFDLVRLPNPDDPEDAGKRRLFHVPQPVLDVPASTAVTRPLGDGWVVDRRKSPTDASPLVAAIGAVWLMQPRPDESKKPMVHDWPEDMLAR